MKDRIFRLAIRLGNDAMCDTDDVARALRSVASKLSGGMIDPGVSYRINDENGNMVGTFTFIDDEA